MSFSRVFYCKNEEDTKKLAKLFAKIAKNGDIFALYGTLGVGKSCFSRYFIQELTNVDDVPSPTFTLVQTYEANGFDIYHYDMYRLKTPEEAFELGVEESFYNGVNLIEWPEKIASILPKNIWKIAITVEDGTRVFCAECFSDEKEKRLEQIVYG